jgi:hypothetical protein
MSARGLTPRLRPTLRVGPIRPRHLALSAPTPAGFTAEARRALLVEIRVRKPQSKSVPVGTPEAWSTFTRTRPQTLTLANSEGQGVEGSIGSQIGESMTFSRSNQGSCAVRSCLRRVRRPNFLFVRAVTASRSLLAASVRSRKW